MKSNISNIKYCKLKKLLKNLESVLVAFSGGVDSSLVAFAARDVLKNNAVAVTIDSHTLPRSELKNAKKVAKEIGIEHLIVKHNVCDEDFIKNPKDRCYYCKKSDLKILKEIAKQKNIKHVVDGTNANDLKEERYGILALKEKGTISPLAEVNLSKKEIRKLAKEIKLSNAEKPPMACLSTRIPSGERITKERLKRIENAEEIINKILNSNGNDNLNAVVRVRDHGRIARIECSDISLILKNKNEITEKLKDLGFRYVTVDLNGYKGVI